jgi:ribosomal protein S18 acetylase RimI-like enzyme
LTSSSINDHQQVLVLLRDNPKYLEIFSTYAPAHKFIEAVVKADGFSFSVNDEDASRFSMALGSDPVILDGDEIATSRGLQMDSHKFKTQASWDLYSIDTVRFNSFDAAIESNNYPEIDGFLKAHARKSSVWPGNEEVLFWGEIRDQEQLVATGALVQWRTGQVMFASIATHSDYRSKGLAQKLVSQMLGNASRSGISHVGLGVFSENASAKRAYEKVGFNLIGEFTSYQKLDEKPLDLSDNR